MSRILNLVLLSIAVLPMTAHAQSEAQIESRYTKIYKQCMANGDAANGVTSAIMDCNGAEIDRQDAHLNAAYKTAMSDLGAKDKVALRNSERAWIGKRDAQCKRQSSADEGGTMAALIYSQCILDQTIQRTIWLEKPKGVSTQAQFASAHSDEKKCAAASDTLDKMERDGFKMVSSNADDTHEAWSNGKVTLELDVSPMEVCLTGGHDN